MIARTTSLVFPKPRTPPLFSMGAPAGGAGITGTGSGGMFSVSQRLKAKSVTAGELLYRLCPFFAGCAGVYGGGGVVEREGCVRAVGIVSRRRGGFSIEEVPLGLEGRIAGRAGTAGMGEGWAMKDTRSGPGVRSSGNLYSGAMWTMLKIGVLA